jgi:hypothetical protein
MQNIEHILAEGNKPGAPNKELEKVHDDQPVLDIHSLKIKN